MKRSKLIAGILLMILGIGITTGSVVFRYYEHGRNGIMFPGHRIVNRDGAGSYGFKNFPKRPFNGQPNQLPGKRPNTNPPPNQNQDQNSKGGVKQ